jgi:hypothetical protein
MNTLNTLPRAFFERPLLTGSSRTGEAVYQHMYHSIGQADVITGTNVEGPAL